MGTVNQHEIPHVDEASDTLSGDEDGIFAIDRVCKRDESPDQAHIPECCGNPALGMFFRGNPLDNPPHEKGSLSDESDDEPEGVECHKLVGGNCGEREAVEAVRNW